MTKKMPVRRGGEIQEVKLQMARRAPFIDLPVLSKSNESGLVLEVAGVVTRLPMEPLARIETTDKEILRLPSELHSCSDVPYHSGVWRLRRTGLRRIALRLGGQDRL
jgi:hypothetical protein